MTILKVPPKKPHVASTPDTTSLKDCENVTNTNMSRE